ncbi:MAG: hypothetical protein ACC726_16790, partial [Chloroflexota bacterium]
VVLRSFNPVFIRKPGTDDWRLDDIGPPKGRYEFGLVKAPRARPCPGLGDPSAADDPFRMQPWCTANGDGRRLEISGRRPNEDASPALFFLRTACGWDDALFVDIGWPPGEPRDATDGLAHRYVRDPARQVPGAKRYSRRVKRPKDAISTGVTNGYATIWISKKLGEDAILVQVGDRFERWPQSGAGCMGN